MKIREDFYTRANVVQIARELLGKYLFTRIDGQLTGGMITETEAYAGVTDRASHAWNGRRTSRTEVMYSKGGVAYVYLIYGIHSLFNIVTNKEGVPHAVLIRGLYPVEGLDIMSTRLGNSRPPAKMGAGPGLAAKMMGIHFSHSGTILTGEKIWLEDHGLAIDPENISISARIGVDYAAEDSLLPYRFLIDVERTGRK